MGYIDFHAHLSPKEESRLDLLLKMDQLSIDHAVVVAGSVVSPHTLSYHFAKGGGLNLSIDNTAVLESCKKSEGKLFPFFFANPYEPENYEKVGKTFYGLKIAPIVHGVPFADSQMTRLFSKALDLGHSVYLHCLPHAGFTVEDLVRTGEKFPELPLVLGHAGLCQCDYWGVDLIAGLPNLYLETSGAFSHLAKYALDKLGEKRVLFGTEYPLQHPKVEVVKAECIGFSPEMTFRNASRLVDFRRTV